MTESKQASDRQKLWKMGFHCTTQHSHLQIFVLIGVPPSCNAPNNAMRIEGVNWFLDHGPDNHVSAPTPCLQEGHKKKNHYDTLCAPVKMALISLRDARAPKKGGEGGT
jgi:hypothetical protein